MTLGGIIALFLFFAIFGVKILVGFSLLVDKFRGSSPKDQTQTQVIILPPQLDPLPSATNSSTLTISGEAKGDVTILLYVNDEQSLRTKIQENGSFRFSNVSVKDGINMISVKATDDKNNSSDLSEVLTIQVKKNKPSLDISEPSDNALITGEKQLVTVIGKTEPDNTVTVNDRIAIGKSDGSFSYDVPLRDGDQTIIIISKDDAGNETKVERKVTYKK